ncbi:DUF4166 domain-containing protein [Ramlibacter sp.]|uniref:DUF4166 domain-containing protein n=1 Tax=Ramlibacter sp. TaxID=1917967 RepID=UPI00178FF959|nr:DUF4166 domain-containing protein [Ramlibacter sp.]MBA2675535.1 DUF4166 domain-containing protein [Ramlibacter sp.]
MNPSSIYQRAMGPEFDKLALPVRRFHTLSGQHVLHGWVRTDAPASALGRLVARSLGAPRTSYSGPLRFELNAQPGVETWTRFFPGKTMTSRLQLRGQHLVEALGLAQLSFGLVQVDGQLRMQLLGLRFLGVPCPAWLAPRVLAQESGDAERFRFHVHASMPLLGTVASYQGYLDLPPEAP